MKENKVLVFLGVISFVGLVIIPLLLSNHPKIYRSYEIDSLQIENLKLQIKINKETIKHLNH